MKRYLVTINQQETRNDVIYNAVRIEVQNSFKVLYKCYSGVKTLCEQVYQKNHEFKFKLNLPRFPKKKMFESTKNQKNDIRIRSQELQYGYIIIFKLYNENYFKYCCFVVIQFLREFLPEVQQFDETCKLKQIDYKYSKDLYWLQMEISF